MKIIITTHFLSLFLFLFLFPSSFPISFTSDFSLTFFSIIIYYLLNKSFYSFINKLSYFRTTLPISQNTEDLLPQTAGVIIVVEINRRKRFYFINIILCTLYQTNCSIFRFILNGILKEPTFCFLHYPHHLVLGFIKNISQEHNTATTGTHS